MLLGQLPRSPRAVRRRLRHCDYTRLRCSHCVGSKGCKEGEFNCPEGLAVASDGCVVVADSLNHRVQAPACNMHMLMHYKAHCIAHYMVHDIARYTVHDMVHDIVHYVVHYIVHYIVHYMVHYIVQYVSSSVAPQAPYGG